MARPVAVPAVIRGLGALLALLLVPACGGKAGPDAVSRPPPTWQREVREPDRKRLATLWSAWTRSLNEVQAAGQGAEIAALGDLLVPDAARAAPPPAPGTYRCRTIKLGVRAIGAVPGRGRALDIAPVRPCTIAARGGLLWFEQIGGPQRVAGLLYPDRERVVFLGSIALEAENRILPYGADNDRDQVGALRAYGADRWRLELPWPMWQSNLTIIEILPG